MIDDIQASPQRLFRNPQYQTQSLILAVIQERKKFDNTESKDDSKSQSPGQSHRKITRIDKD